MLEIHSKLLVLVVHSSLLLSVIPLRDTVIQEATLEVRAHSGWLQPSTHLLADAFSFLLSKNGLAGFQDRCAPRDILSKKLPNGSPKSWALLHSPQERRRVPVAPITLGMVCPVILAVSMGL